MAFLCMEAQVIKFIWIRNATFLTKYQNLKRGHHVLLTLKTTFEFNETYKLLLE